jgi:hypothetical protein
LVGRKIIKSGGPGPAANIFIGIIGGAGSGFIFHLIDISGSGLTCLMETTTLEAIALFYAVGLFKNAKESSIYYRGNELWIQRKPLNKR